MDSCPQLVYQIGKDKRFGYDILGTQAEEIVAVISAKIAGYEADEQIRVESAQLF